MPPPGPCVKRSQPIASPRLEPITDLAVQELTACDHLLVDTVERGCSKGSINRVETRLSCHQLARLGHATAFSSGGAAAEPRNVLTKGNRRELHGFAEREVGMEHRRELACRNLVFIGEG